jgi:N-acyl homoserine lactone hydrolase
MRPADVVPLRLGDVELSAGEGNEGGRLPVLGFLIRLDEGSLLFETGIGEGRPDIDSLFKPHRRAIEQALSEAGIVAEDIVAVANSHLHFDHSGNNRSFAGVPIHIQSRERRAAAEPDYTVPEWIEFAGATYEEHDGDTLLAEEVRLVATPGHTAGHQSMVLSTEEGPVILAGQAVYTIAEWTGSSDPRESGVHDSWNPDAYRASVDRLRAFDPVAVHFSHDEAVWWRSNGAP